MVILAVNMVAGCLLLVDTIDLLTGGRLRRGSRALVPATVLVPIVTRSIILEETRIGYADDWQ
jgi:hypothetical protein